MASLAALDLVTTAAVPSVEEADRGDGCWCGETQLVSHLHGTQTGDVWQEESKLTMLRCGHQRPQGEPVLECERCAWAIGTPHLAAIEADIAAGPRRFVR